MKARRQGTGKRVLSAGESRIQRQESPTQKPQSRRAPETCFVMMPFNARCYRCYQQVYVPAIKEAGFMPVCGESNNSNIGVIEQIKYYIDKAYICIAHLADRNLNVMYELGFAHARGKRVVLTAGSQKDVPFDVRHLPVIYYDRNNPDWGQALERELIKYLKNDE